MIVYIKSKNENYSYSIKIVYVMVNTVIHIVGVLCKPANRKKKLSK